MSLNNYQVREDCYNASHTLLSGVRKVCTTFYTFHRLNTTQTMSTNL